MGDFMEPEETICRFVIQWMFQFNDRHRNAVGHLPAEAMQY
jgi:hypothetical protein